MSGTERQIAVQHSGASPGKLTHLFEIEPEEVSVVDRPANRRKFLIVKREEADVGFKIVEGKDGKLVLQKSDAGAAGSEPKKPGEEDADKAAAGSEGAKKEGGGDEFAAWAKKAAEHLLAAAEAVAGQSEVTPDAQRHLSAAAEQMGQLMQAMPEKAAKTAAEAAPAESVGLLAVSKGGTAIDVLAREIATKLLSLPGQGAEAVAKAVAGAKSALDTATNKGATKMKPGKDDDMDKSGKPGAPGAAGGPPQVAGANARKFSSARVGKLAAAFASIGEVLKEVGASNLGELLGIAKAEASAEAEVVTKALGEIGVSAESIAKSAGNDEVADLRARLARLESVGVSKAAGADGDTGKGGVQKGDGDLWKGVI